MDCSGSRSRPGCRTRSALMLGLPTSARLLFSQSIWPQFSPALQDPLLRMAPGQYGRGMAAKPYGDVDPDVLKGLPNPGGAIELKEHK
jgi:hypothetical protein